MEQSNKRRCTDGPEVGPSKRRCIQGVGIGQEQLLIQQPLTQQPIAQQPIAQQEPLPQAVVQDQGHYSSWDEIMKRSSNSSSTRSNPTVPTSQPTGIGGKSSGRSLVQAVVQDQGHNSSRYKSIASIRDQTIIPCDAFSKKMEFVEVSNDNLHQELINELKKVGKPEPNTSLKAILQKPMDSKYSPSYVFSSKDIENLMIAKVAIQRNLISPEKNRDLTDPRWNTELSGMKVALDENDILKIHHLILNAKMTSSQKKWCIPESKSGDFVGDFLYKICSNKVVYYRKGQINSAKLVKATDLDFCLFLKGDFHGYERKPTLAVKGVDYSEGTFY